MVHRPDNLVISNLLINGSRSEKAIHTIIRDVFDKEFGPQARLMIILS